MHVAGFLNGSILANYNFFYGWRILIWSIGGQVSLHVNVYPCLASDLSLLSLK